MKARKTLTKLLAISLTVGMVAGIWSVWGARPSEAVIAIIKTTGMFSLTQGQATSAHVVNTWGGDEHQTVIDWTVFDSSGNILARSEEQTVLPGQSANFEYGTGVYSPAPGQRTAIRLVLRVEGASRSPNSGTPGPDNFIATQEVYNIADGKTTVFLPYIEQ